MKPDKNKTINESNQPNESLLFIGFLSLILLHIIGGYWHSCYSWGISYWAVLSKESIVIFGILAIIALLVVYIFREKIKFSFMHSKFTSTYSKVYKIIIYVLSSISIGIVLFLVRSKAHIYGDGYSVLKLCSSFNPLEITNQLYVQLLAVYWHQFVYKILSPFSVLDNELIFSITNVVGGVIGVFGIYKLTKELAQNFKEHIFLLILSLSSASIVLFFGYIENYTWAMSCMLWALYYNLRCSKGTCSVFPLLFFTVLTFAFHMVTLPIVVVTIYVIFYRQKKLRSFVTLFSKKHFIFLILLGSFIIIYISQKFELTIFVSLWNNIDSHYSFFSLNHLLDVVNLLLLLSPLGLLFLIISLTKNNNKEDISDNILFLSSFLFFLTTCVIDPQLGMMRDFDLFALYGVPMTVWGGYRYLRHDSNNKLEWLITASTIIVIVHVVPNLYEKNNLQKAVTHLDKILYEDPHYQIEYQKAYRGNSWGYILRRELNRDDLAKKYFVRRMSVKKDDSQVYYNLGLMHFKEKNYDSTRYYLLTGFDMYPDPKFVSKLSILEEVVGNHDLAMNYARKSLVIDSNHVEGLTSLAVCFGNKEQNDSALYYFRKAYDLRSDSYEQIINLGILYSRAAIVDSAEFYLSKAIDIAPAKYLPDILSTLITLHVNDTNKAQALEYLEQLKKVKPNSALVREKEKEIYGK